MADGHVPPPSQQQQDGSQIPQAPPLPPRSTFQRLAAQLPSLNAAARPQSLNAGGRSDGTRPKVPAPPLPIISGIDALSSQDATHKTGLEIWALDINHDSTQAILAGRDILKTVSVHGTRCSEALNLRSAIINYASHNARGSARHRETLDIHDVKWSHGNYKNFIATAATNGKIVLYDLNRAGIEIARLHEHHRQVHKLAFNPYQPSSLLSASQDGTVRLWDLRDLSRQREVIVCRSRQAYHGQSEGIRDVRWSPTNGEQFAFCTDNGAVQKWEVRNAKSPILRINAHDKLCHAIDWHPDGKHVLSASADKTVKVWDFSSDQRRQKAAWTLRAPYPVSNVRWRPPCRSSDGRDSDSGPWQCTQFATTFEKHAQVLIWDFRRPYVPFREIVRGSAPPSDMLWHSQHLLWTVGREGVFAQSDVHYAPKVLDRRNLQAIAVAPTGEVSAFSQKRSKRRDRPFGHQSSFSMSTDSRDSQAVADPVAIGSISRSSADDSVDDSFLSSSQRKHHGRTLSNRSAKSFGSTPPSEEAPVKGLGETLKDLKSSHKPQQVAFRGSLDTSIDPAVFAFLAQKYKHHPQKKPGTASSFHDAHRLFNVNAEYAQRVSFYRIAQSFRILGSVTQHQLQYRAEALRRRRSGQESTRTSRKTSHALDGHRLPAAEKSNGPRPGTQAIQAVTSPLKAIVDSTSNAATPLARPHGSDGAHSHRTVPSLSGLDAEPPVALPPPVAGPASIPTGEARLAGAQRPEFHGPYWFDGPDHMAERRAMLSNYRQAPKQPLDLEPPGLASPQTQPINIPPPLDRHHSGDSFAMFSTSTDSRGISMPGSFASGRSPTKQFESAAGGWQRVDSNGSSSVWQSDSDPASSEAAASVQPQQQSWAEGEPFEPSSSSKASSAHIEAKSEDKVRFVEPEEIASPPANPAQPAATAAKAPRTHLIKEESMNLSGAFGSSSYSGTGSQPSHSTWSTSNTSSSQFGNLDASGTIVAEPDEPYTRALAATDAKDGADRNQAKGSLPMAKPEGLSPSGYGGTTNTSENAGLTFSINDMLRVMLEYHTTNLSDAQTSAQMLLLLAPLLPQGAAIVGDVAFRTFAVYSDMMNTLGLTDDALQKDVSRTLEHMLDSGLHPLQAESILSTYHEQLVSLNLLNAAANLRKLCFPAFPAVYEQSTKDTRIGLRCQGCRNPLNNPNGKLRCEHCSRRQAPCPICWCDTPAIDHPAPKAKKPKRRRSTRTRASSLAAAPSTAGLPASFATDMQELAADPSDGDPAAATAAATQQNQQQPAALWLTCPLCNHSAHLSCFSAWLTSAFEPGDLAEGACPSPGCTCDCAPGALRDERAHRTEQRVALRDRERGREGRAVRDEWRASESRAVSQVRGMMDSTGSLPSREGRGDRRVRLLDPEEYEAQGLQKPRRSWVMGN